MNNIQKENGNNFKFVKDRNDINERNDELCLSKWGDNYAIHGFQEGASIGILNLTKYDLLELKKQIDEILM